MYKGILTITTLSYDSLIKTLLIDNPIPKDKRKEDLFYALYRVQDAS